MHPLHSKMLAVLGAALATLSTVAQDQPEPFGTILKSEVDGLVRALRDGGDDPSFGGVRDTAKALTALGHCHRFYSQDDGPVVRDPIRKLFAGRRADGAFAAEDDTTEGDVARTTAWCVEALEVMEPELYADDVAQAREWLQKHGHSGPGPWRARVNSIRQAFGRGEGDPASLGRAALPGPATNPGDLAKPVAVDTLVTLVACQVVAREHDRALASGDTGDGWSETRQQGVAFLLTQQEDGVFYVETPAGRFPDPGLSALALAALQTKPAELRSAEEQAVIDAGLQTLAAQQNDDGSFAERNANYTTCAAVLALSRADRPEFEPLLQKAQQYLLAIQNVEQRGYARADRDYGSVGYGGDQRGDLSNLQFAVQALRETGLDADHEALQKALVFLRRTQNLREVNDYEGRVRNDGEWYEVVPGDDGGSAYYPGNSPAGYIELPDGKRIPRSYGSMTYALLKCYILAGVAGDDPRVQAAVDWARGNWTLDVNPGAAPSLGEKAQYQGLYYYYMVLAQALDTAGIDTLEATPPAAGDDAEPIEVDWRAELRAHLAELQRDDGSWVNAKNGRWWEDKKAICTTYALLALERCH